LDIRRSQHYNYTHETIPIVWHRQNADFLKYIDKDGISFLRFWWKHLENALGVQILSSSEGLGYQVKTVPDKNKEEVKIILLTLPKPETVGEVFYMILVKIPESRVFLARFFLLKLPTTRVFSLELEGQNEDGSARTGIYELTPRARNIRMKTGTEPVLDTFYKEILKVLKLER
jgi:hypothetical protein